MRANHISSACPHPVQDSLINFAIGLLESWSLLSRIVLGNKVSRMCRLRPSLNCRTPEQFSEKLEYALKHDPHPMTTEERTRLTWEAATERFLDVAELKGEERAPPPVSATVDKLAFNLHNYLTGTLPPPQSSGAIFSQVWTMHEISRQFRLLHASRMQEWDLKGAYRRQDPHAPRSRMSRYYFALQGHLSCK